MMRELYGPLGSIVGKVIVAEDDAIDRVDVYTRTIEGGHTLAGSLTVRRGDGQLLAVVLVSVMRDGGI